MSNEIVTCDLSEFGTRELLKVAELLKAYGENKGGDHGLYDGVKPWFNRSSGCVFLCDEDYNTAMLNDVGELERWQYCGHCGHEGFISEFDDDTGDDDARACPECGEVI